MSYQHDKEIRKAANSYDEAMRRSISAQKELHSFSELPEPVEPFSVHDQAQYERFLSYRASYAEEKERLEEASRREHESVLELAQALIDLCPPGVWIRTEVKGEYCGICIEYREQYPDDPIVWFQPWNFVEKLREELDNN